MCVLSALLAIPPAASAQAIFQPGFHQALRSSVTAPAHTTYRMKIPVGRAGSRLRLDFTAGDGSLTLHAATVAVAGSQGKLPSAPATLTFNGAAGFTAVARQRVASDPIPFPIAFGAELYVSFEVTGAMAASTINAFPDSYSFSGSVTATQTPSGGRPFMQAVALDTVEVEGPSGLAMVALGDSITEGYVSGDTGTYVSRNDDTRNAWPAVAQKILGVPVVNAAVSGQGVFDAIDHLNAEVLTLKGLTDCLILIGTNDLGGNTAEQIEAGLANLFDKLRFSCRVWASTLLPKDRTSNGVYATVVTRRLAVNDWIRHQAKVDGVLDLEPALAAPGNINLFGPGLGEDGIHPSVAGHLIMGQVAAKTLAPLLTTAVPHIEAVLPTSGNVAGGTNVEISGVNFVSGATVTIGGVATQVMISGSGTLTAKTGPHAPGPVDIVLSNPDGQAATLPGGYTYTSAADPVPPVVPDPTAFPAGGCNGAGAPPSLLLLLPFLGLAAGRRRLKRR